MHLLAFAIYLASSANIEIGEISSFEGVISSGTTSTLTSNGNVYKNILTFSPSTPLTITCDQDSNPDEDCPISSKSATEMHLVFQNNQSKMNANSLRGKNATIYGKILIPSGEGWATYFVLYADSVKEIADSQNPLKHKLSQDSISPQIDIGGYTIGEARLLNGGPNRAIYSATIKDSTVERILLYIHDTLRLIQTSYPSIQESNYESSSKFKEMFSYFTLRFGKPNEVKTDHLGNFENQFGKPVRKLWIWKTKSSVAQLIATSTSIDKELLRLCVKAQAQHLQRSNYKYMARPISDIEYELNSSLSLAIRSGTSIELKVWSNVDANEFGKALVACDMNVDSCENVSKIFPSEGRFSNIDAPSSWFELKNADSYLEQQNAEFLGSTFSSIHKGKKIKINDDYLLISSSTVMDQKTKNRLKTLVATAAPSLITREFNQANADTKQQLAKKLMDSIMDQYFSALSVAKTLEIRSAKTNQMEKFQP